MVIYDRKRRLVIAGNSGIAIRTPSDIADALDASIGSLGLLLTERDLGSDFFDLRTTLAGELFQKFTNYNQRIAIVAPNPSSYGEPFAELAYEHATHPLIRVVASEAEAEDWLLSY